MSTTFYRVQIGVKHFTIPGALKMSDAISRAIELDGCNSYESLQIWARKVVIDTPDPAGEQLSFEEEA